MLTRDRVDWVAKKFLLNALQEAKNSPGAIRGCNRSIWNITSLDSTRASIMSWCAGAVRRIVTEEEIKAAIFNPPETTRAFFRGRAVARSIMRSNRSSGTRLSFKINRSYVGLFCPKRLRTPGSAR